MSNAMIKTNNAGVLVPTNMSEAMEFAKLVAGSGMIPKQYENKPAAVLVAIQMGAELGLSPMASLQNIAVINGRPSVWGDALLALCSGHPDFEDCIEKESDTGATCVIKRKGRTAIERTFTVDDAKKAGLWGKAGPWQQYPKRMLKMRARGFALRDAFPDALRGVISAEEASDYQDTKPLQEGRSSFGFKKEQPKPEPVVVDAVVIETKTNEPPKKSPAEAFELAVVWFAKHGASREQLLKYIGGKVTEDGIAKLRVLREGIAAGTTTAEASMIALPVYDKETGEIEDAQAE